MNVLTFPPRFALNDEDDSHAQLDAQFTRSLSRCQSERRSSL